MVFTFYNDPSVQKNYLSYDAALILVVIVLILLVASRIIVARTQRHSESARTANAGTPHLRPVPHRPEPDTSPASARPSTICPPPSCARPVARSDLLRWRAYRSKDEEER